MGGNTAVDHLASPSRHNFKSANDRQPISTPKSAITPEEQSLIEAASRGNIDKIYELYWNNCNINCRHPITGATPLSAACQSGQSRVVSLLLDLGANGDVKDEYGVTPLHWAANWDNPDMVKKLVDKCSLSLSQLNVQDHYGASPLHFAAVRNNINTVQVLIKSGSNTRLVNNDSKKPSEVTSKSELRNIFLDEEARQAQAQQEVQLMKQRARIRRAKSAKGRPTRAKSAGTRPSSSKTKPSARLSTERKPRGFIPAAK